MAGSTTDESTRGKARGVYSPRCPAETVLYQAVDRSLETFLAWAVQQGRSVPGFVEQELRDFLACGVLAHGFVRVHCAGCGFDRVVPLSCKRRGFCPSCKGKRMAEVAAHLVDRVFPHVPVRQWVLTLPVELRYVMAYDSDLTTAVLGELLRAVFGSLRRRARRNESIRYPHCGSITFIQRFGDALNLNPHFHALVLDGIYDLDDPDGGRFLVLPPPGKEELLRVLRRFAKRIDHLLEQRGLRSPEASDPCAERQPLLAGLANASIRSRIATGARVGQPVRRLGDRVAVDTLEDDENPCCARFAGYTLHAGVSVPANDRARLERLCRYAGRPPVATERLSLREDGGLEYRLRHRWRDGTTHVVLDPLELIEKLAALVPPPRAHQLRYHGILAPAASRRGEVVPARWAEGEALPARPSRDTAKKTDDATPHGRPERMAWAELMLRVFEIDVLECPRCAGRLRIIATIRSKAAVRAILECLGLPSRAPPIAAADPLLVNLAANASGSASAADDAW